MGLMPVDNTPNPRYCDIVQKKKGPASCHPLGYQYPKHSKENLKAREVKLPAQGRKEQLLGLNQESLGYASPWKSERSHKSHCVHTHLLLGDPCFLAV